MLTLNKFEFLKKEFSVKEIVADKYSIGEKLADKDLDKPILEKVNLSEELFDEINLDDLLERKDGELEGEILDMPILERLGIDEDFIDKINVNENNADDISIDEKHKEEIEKLKEEDKEDFTNLEKGNFGEIVTDQELKEKGYERISLDKVEALDDKGSTGIDGVYYNPEGEPKYIIVESKYGSSKLSETADGKQMSENWIDNRLDEAVGKEMADEIRMSDSSEVGSYVSRVDSEGNIEFDKLDSQGNVIEKDVEINA